jgi:hypothetical protein
MSSQLQTPRCTSEKKHAIFADPEFRALYRDTTRTVAGARTTTPGVEKPADAMLRDVDARGARGATSSWDVDDPTLIALLTPHLAMTAHRRCSV